MAPFGESPYRERNYERPNQPWECGFAKDGRPCSLGPDKKGRCRTRSVCRPAKRGDRWTCTRTHNEGGPCTTGPEADGACAQQITPCMPRRSSRMRRKLTVIWVIGLTLALVMIAVGSKSHWSFLSPGPLSSAHAGATTTCKDCHTTGEVLPAAWIKTAFHPPSGLKDGERCQSCHLVGPNPLQPHGQPEARLQDESGQRAQRAGVWLDGLLPLAQNQEAQIACARCHREHQGAWDITSVLSDTRCQACHADPFPSFQEGHPQLENYPYKRVLAVAFDHGTHFGKHFQDDKVKERAPQACDTCHLAGPEQGMMLTQPFEQACSSCHLEGIQGEARAGTKGVAVLALPGLDTDTLEEAGLAVGQWPSDADHGLTPFLRFWLDRVPGLRADLELCQTVDLLDLTAADRKALEAVHRLALGLKDFLYRLRLEGHGFLVGLLGPDEIDPLVSAGLTALWPAAEVHQALEQWFPGLQQEMARLRQGLPIVASDKLFPKNAGEGAATVSSDVKVQVDDRPTGGDDILGGDEILEDDDILGGDEILEDDDILGGDEILEEPSTQKPAQADEILEDDDILGGDEILEDDDILGGDEILEGPSTQKPAQADDDLLAQDDDILSAPEDSSAGGEAQHTGIAAVEIKAVSEENWVSQGGWYRFNFALYYRPTGHRDLFMQSWLALLRSKAPQDETAAVLLARMADPKAPGSCAKCHNGLDKPGPDPIRWYGLRPSTHTQEFTKFRHGPHLSLAVKEGCEGCHNLEAVAEQEPHAEEAQAKPPGFSPLTLEKCLDCHQPGKAESNCLTCHNYHVGQKPLTVTGRKGQTPQIGQ